MAGGAVIVAGFGFRASATKASLAGALEAAAGGARVDMLAAPKDKAPRLAALAGRLGVEVAAVGPEALAAVETATRSEASLAARGTGSVAEAAALAAAGPGARLIAARAVSADRRATCALAEGHGAGAAARADGERL